MPAELQTVQYTIKPEAKLTMAFIFVCVIRGDKNPLEVLSTSEG